MAVVRSLLFYIVFYSASAVFVLVAMLMLGNPGRLRAVTDCWSRFHRQCVERILGIHIVQTGTMPKEPTFYAIKHESFFEAIDLPCEFDHPAAFAKAELFEIPGWGRCARAYGMIPVARKEGARTLRTMLKEIQPHIRAGRPIVIFPEGTRVPHGTRAPLQAGFAALYKLLGLPVVPVAIDSGPTYHRLWKRPGTIRVHFGEPIEPGLDRADIEERVLAAINLLNA